jgi:hypothetical protein
LFSIIPTANSTPTQNIRTTKATQIHTAAQQTIENIQQLLSMNHHQRAIACFHIQIYQEIVLNTQNKKHQSLKFIHNGIFPILKVYFGCKSNTFRRMFAGLLALTGSG